MRMLDLLDRGKPLELDQSARWTGVYGPDMIDVTLDLLFDGMTGLVDLRNKSQLTELEFARELALVADAPEQLIRVQSSPSERPMFSFSPSLSYLPPLSSTLERFVRECRCVCAQPKGGHAAQDEILVQAAE